MITLPRPTRQVVPRPTREVVPRQRPGHQLQVDVKFIEPLGQTGRRKKYYQFTAIDDCTRLRVLRAYPRCDQKTAIQFIDHVLSKLPFAVERVQTDNGSEFGTSFHWHLLDKGIDHVHIKPRTPTAQRQGRAIPPHRLRGVLPAPRRPSHRRRQPLHRQAARVGGLLQLPPPSRRPRRPNALRTPPAESPRPTVIGLRQLHTRRNRNRVPKLSSSYRNPMVKHEPELHNSAACEIR